MSDPSLPLGAVATATAAAVVASSSSSSSSGSGHGGMDERFVGFVLAVVSSILIGASFCVKKHGLNKSEGHGTPSPQHYAMNAQVLNI